VPAGMEHALAVEARALRRLARIGEVVRDGAPDGRAGAHAVLRSGAELFIPLEGIIDVDKERERLRKELERVEGQLRSSEARLASESFVTRAPAEVVERERAKVSNFKDQRDRLAEKLAALT
jgi:valyl-tRNA synthetase